MSPTRVRHVFLIAVAIVTVILGVSSSHLLLAQEILVDAPLLVHKIYLPQMHGNTYDVSSAESPIQLNEGEVPFDELPICPEIPPIDSTKSLPPDDSKPICRVESILIIDVSELIERGEDPADYGIGGDPVWSEYDPNSVSSPSTP